MSHIIYDSEVERFSMEMNHQTHPKIDQLNMEILNPDKELLDVTQSDKIFHGFKVTL